MAAPPLRLSILPLLVRTDWVWGAGRPPWGHGFGPGVAAAAGRVLHVSTRLGATRNTGLPASRSGQLEAGEPGWAPAARGSGPGGPAGCAIPLRRLGGGHVAGPAGSQAQGRRGRPLRGRFPGARWYPGAPLGFRRTRPKRPTPAHSSAAATHKSQRLHSVPRRSSPASPLRALATRRAVSLSVPGWTFCTIRHWLNVAGVVPELLQRLVVSTSGPSKRLRDASPAPP